jgi:hypothetical protein
MCDAGSITINQPYAMNIEESHTFAAVALVRKLGWYQEVYGCKMARGGMPQSSPYAYVFVFVGTKTADLDMVDVQDEKWKEKR